ncbi:MAG: transferrin-binding protein-like solute binding protein [Beijerinckiaceae bacterium]|nr:transferrin-binding protein-like solute binding protein [Beijerinckiaceae bacterium]
MFSPSVRSAGVVRIVLVGALAGGLGGCYSMSGDKSSSPTTPPAPAKFTAASGTINSKAVVTQVVSNAYTNAATMTVETTTIPTRIQTQVQALNDNSGLQRVDTSVGTYGWFGASDGKMETNGSAVRGAAVNSSDTWAVYTNTPGSRLDASLGAPSLEHSYAGLGALGKRAAGSTGAFYSNAFAFFGGKSTTDMPTSGKADFAGSFEGLEQVATANAPVQTSNISGKANMTADFAAKTIRGRIDDINNHSVGPLKQPAGYSIGYDGRITDSSFAGASWLTQRNSDAPLAATTQNSGNVQGGFFGPGAAEAAGALGVSAQDASRKTLVTGAFGARKK